MTTTGKEMIQLNNLHKSLMYANNNVKELKYELEILKSDKLINTVNNCKHIIEELKPEKMRIIINSGISQSSYNNWITIEYEKDKKQKTKTIIDS